MRIIHSFFRLEILGNSLLNVSYSKFLRPKFEKILKKEFKDLVNVLKLNYDVKSNDIELAIVEAISSNLC